MMSLVPRPSPGSPRRPPLLLSLWSWLCWAGAVCVCEARGQILACGCQAATALSSLRMEAGHPQILFLVPPFHF